MSAYNGRGNVYFDRKDYDRAIADFNRVIELDPKSPGGYYSSATAYNKKLDYDKAIELDPKYAIAYNNRGLAYERKNDRARAIADYR